VDIGIVGAGFAGMSAALFLARDGHRVTLYERAEKPGPVGAAIVLQPSGLAVLRQLDLDRGIAAKSARIDRLHVTTAKGKTVVDLDYASLDPSWFGLGVGRGVLFDALWSQLASHGVVVRTSSDVTALAVSAPGSARARSTGGPEAHALVTREGDRLGPHELIVAADGSRSSIAGHIPGRSVKPYPWGALFFVGPASDDASLRQIADGARRFMGVLPMGHGRASLFWSLRADRLASWRSGFAGWREEALELGPHAESLIDAIGGPDEVLFAPYFDVRMKRWFAPGIVAIGDAAHATSPQLGQGSNLALWDAFVLAQSLRAHPDDVAVALERYSRLRRRHLAYYQRATRWLTPLFQGDSRVLGVVRDVGLPIACRIGPLRRLMTASMAGVAAGFFGRREPLPGPWP